MKQLIELSATFFYSGYLRPASGTWGSLLAWIIYGILFHTIGINYYGMGISILIITLLGVYTSSEFEKESQKHDPSEVVIDEWAGQWIALILIPQNYLAFFLAFFLFRFFDITKIWPANIAQKLPGGWGIMVDDIIAGIYAGLVIKLIFA